MNGTPASESAWKKFRDEHQKNIDFIYKLVTTLGAIGTFFVLWIFPNLRLVSSGLYCASAVTVTTIWFRRKIEPWLVLESVTFLPILAGIFGIAMGLTTAVRVGPKPTGSESWMLVFWLSGGIAYLALLPTFIGHHFSLTDDAVLELQTDVLTLLQDAQAQRRIFDELLVHLQRSDPANKAQWEELTADNMQARAALITLSHRVYAYPKLGVKEGMDMERYRKEVAALKATKR